MSSIAFTMVINNFDTFAKEVNCTLKDMARLLPARSLHQSAANVHCSGAKELCGPTKGATEAACRPVPEGRNRGKVKLIPSSGNDTYSRKSFGSPLHKSPSVF